MLTGVNFQQAIKYWTQGREVIVLDRTVKSPSGGYETYSLEELFRNLEFLADVPAVKNLEFEQAVADMTKDTDQKMEKPAMEGKNTPPSTRPEVSELLQVETGKTKKETALELAAHGMSTAEIAKQMGESYSNVYYWTHKDKSRKKKQKKVSGWNADRHGCRTCQYRAEKKGCDYYIITDRERGCDPADCNRYEKGERLGEK